MNRKIQTYDDDGHIETFWVKGEMNPCGCGSNCYHHEDDGTIIFGVCNACGLDIYRYKQRFEFKFWKWKTEPTDEFDYDEYNQYLKLKKKYEVIR